MLSIQNSVPSSSLANIFIAVMLMVPLILSFNVNAFTENNKKNEVIFFLYDDHTLTGKAKNKLDIFISEYKKNNDYHIKITGYSDKKGKPEYNKKLSARRIESVTEYLIAGGIDSKNIKSLNIGSTEDFSNSGDNDNSLELNRRVELSMYRSDFGSQAKSDPEIRDNYGVGSGDILTMDVKFVIQHELKKIASEKIKFDVPEEIYENESDTVNVIIADDLISVLSGKLRNNTYKIFETITSIELSALSLNSNDMNIDSIQENQSGRWVWRITPHESGLRTVNLMISLRFTTSNGAEDVISLPIMLKTVSIVDIPYYFLSDVYRKGLFIIFILIIALGIFTMVSKKYGKKTSRDNLIA